MVMVELGFQMHIDHELMPCKCTNKLCTVYSKCCFLPTEVNPDLEGKVSMLFVGQGGGSDERKQGRPFIGRAGKRIRQQVMYVREKLGKHIGVAFSNTIRDNPEGNRIPNTTELGWCLKHLYVDIAVLMKRGLKVVVPLGNASKDVFIEEAGGMAAAHGKLYDISNDIFGTIKVMPTYHPSYVIRNAPKFNDKVISEYDAPVIRDLIGAYKYFFEEK